MDELANTVRAYLAGELTRKQLAEELDAYDIWNRWQDDDPEVRALRPLVGGLELLLHDIAEGRRTAAKLRPMALQIIAAGTGEEPVSAFG